MLGIIAGPSALPGYDGRESNTHDMTARVTLRVRINAYQVKPTGIQSSLLIKLPPAGILDRFSNLYETAGKRQTGLKGRVTSFHKYHASCPVEGDTVDSEERCCDLYQSGSPKTCAYSTG